MGPILALSSQRTPNLLSVAYLLRWFPRRSAIMILFQDFCWFSLPSLTLFFFNFFNDRCDFFYFLFIPMCTTLLVIVSAPTSCSAYCSCHKWGDQGCMHGHAIQTWWGPTGRPRRSTSSCGSKLPTPPFVIPRSALTTINN